MTAPVKLTVHDVIRQAVNFDLGDDIASAQQIASLLAGELPVTEAIRIAAAFLFESRQGNPNARRYITEIVDGKIGPKSVDTGPSHLDACMEVHRRREERLRREVEVKEAATRQERAMKRLKRLRITNLKRPNKQGT